MAKLPKLPVNLTSRAFQEREAELFRWMLEEAPVCRARALVMPVTLVARHADCIRVLKGPGFTRNRTKATGKGRFPFPVPSSVRFLIKAMINEDDPEHGRLRGLVAQAFTPAALTRIEARIAGLVEELLDRFDGPVVELIAAYCLPIPVTVIQEMLGIEAADMPRFRESLRVVSGNLNLWTLFRAFVFDLPRTTRLLEGMIERKRAKPEEDILTGLIHAEEDGRRLSREELISMVYLLIAAGYETTVHLLANGVLTLLRHPEQLRAFREDEGAVDGAIEEILRFAGPVQGTKPEYACEDVEIAGATIPRGSMVFPALGAANRDPRVFSRPDDFDICRDPNPHLSFGYGQHYCLGASLARMEARLALTALFRRFPRLELAVPVEELRRQRLPFWLRYRELPVRLEP